MSGPQGAGIQEALRPYPKAISVNDAAYRVCSMSDWTVTNQDLHKILYLLQMIYMGNHGGRPLIDTYFEAWDFGPIIPELYQDVKMFGDRPIKDVFYSIRKVDDPGQERVFDENVPWLLKQTPGQLVAITHWKSGAWAKSYDQRKQHSLIPSADILEEFRKRVARSIKSKAPQLAEQCKSESVYPTSASYNNTF